MKENGRWGEMKRERYVCGGDSTWLQLIDKAIL